MVLKNNAAPQSPPKQSVRMTGWQGRAGQFPLAGRQVWHRDARTLKSLQDEGMVLGMQPCPLRFRAKFHQYRRGPKIFPRLVLIV
ncbi:hypothetical protein GGP72_002635 [Salinibacter ruber]|uniref:Uncharacterized protein n=1 Tax=Salinibacter ruber TaxID=146919 RepID=A0A9X2Q0T1_9BACT|nr:hypothetical protein [Salinibacter ruber]MCS3681981.1 hypothetical protein [Salinibacter ruber]MCS3703025.1 hypothetical protein [Salinibacter ruber]